MSDLIEKHFHEEIQEVFFFRPIDGQRISTICQQFIAQYPDFYKPYATLAFLAEKAGLYAEAKVLMRQALERAPLNSRVQKNYRRLEELYHD